MGKNSVKEKTMEEMKDIFKTISSTIDKINDEKQSVEDTANKKAVKSVIDGITDLREIISIVFSYMKTEETIRDLLHRGIVKCSGDKNHQSLIIKRYPHDTTDVSELFSSTDIISIEEKGNLKKLTTELKYPNIKSLVLESGDEAVEHVAIINNRKIEFFIDGKRIRVFIEDGIRFDRVGQIFLEL